MAVYALAGAATTYAIAWAFALQVDVCAFGLFSSGPLTCAFRARDCSMGEGEGSLLVMRVEGWGSSQWTSSISSERCEPQPPEPELHFGPPVTEAPMSLVCGPMADWLLPESGCWPNSGVEQLHMVWARGWPFLAVRCARSESKDSLESSKTDSVSDSEEPPHPRIKGGIQAEYRWFRWLPMPLRQLLHGYDEPVVPWMPIPLGLAADSAIYGSLYWLLLTGPGRVRRALRRRRGRCARCGYDLSGTPTDAPCPECGQRAVVAR
jgi:hypothetical protein